ncbi:uncharacterized protein EAE97_009036 [Botrytis byssoidea]|uniref:2EXR domain-containing protein n=1 Tax=Botrytis byssoidea TaxID=139641 RepID=A0A9P5LRV9_9HELO|nr:uncharacterized protein EAE97_009036 [Botrytis byssoidea]KAF7932015.1 hypothetical protein EAE97_009036 [Botrytis byssoidea]
MPNKSKPPKPSLPKQRSLRSNVNTHAIFVPKCPNCSLPQYEGSIRPRRPANYYEDNFNDRTTFTCFMELPLEIRVMVWEASLPGPRVVLLRPTWIFGWKTSRCFGSHEVIRVPDYVVQSSNPVTALYVCRESFNVASTRYTQTFASPESPFKTWFDFDFDFDTLCIAPNEAFHHRLPAVFAEPLPVTALDKEYDTEEWWWSFQNPYVLEVFLDVCLIDAGRLEELTLVTGRYPCNTYVFTPKRSKDLSFIELQDIDASLKLYTGLYEPKLEASIQSIQKEYAAQLRSLASIKFDKLEKCRSVTYGAPVYEMPVIRSLIVTTTSMKAKLEQAKVAFEVKKAEYMKCNGLLAM